VQGEPLVIDFAGAIPDTGRNMDVVARHLRRPRHGQPMHDEKPVFGDEIENLFRHQVDNLCRIDSKRFPGRAPSLEHQNIPKQVLLHIAAADRRSVNEAGDAAHRRFLFDPDPSLRIFITRSSALQQSCCYRRELPARQ
jgi:hypothetical protein